ncbi:hypothetical protein VTI74DRAFT_10191 [Chaetomium olivicolor]
MQGVVSEKDQISSFSIMSAGRADQNLGSDRCAAPHIGAPAPLGRCQGRKDPLGSWVGMRDFRLQNRTVSTWDSLATDPTTDLALTSLSKGERTGSHISSRYGRMSRAAVVNDSFSPACQHWTVPFPSAGYKMEGLVKDRIEKAKLKGYNLSWATDAFGFLPSEESLRTYLSRLHAPTPSNIPKLWPQPEICHQKARDHEATYICKSI